MRYLLLIVVLLIVYGSTYPFNFSSASAGPWAWQQFLGNWNLTTSLGDVLGNLGMFIPFGLIGMLALLPINRLWARTGLVLLLGFILAFVLQGMQIYLPTRSPALSDVLWNMVGVALGIAIGLFVEKRGWSVQRSVSTYLSLPSCILLVWFVAELLPLVPSLNLQGIIDSFKPLFLDPDFSIVDAFFQAAGVLLAGRLLAAIVGESASIRVLPVLIGLLLLGKVLVVTLVLDLSTCVGVTVGYVCWWVIHAWHEPRRSQTIFFVLFFAYTLSALMPLAIRTGPVEFNWIPFADSLQGSMLTNVQALGNRLAVYGGLLWLWQALGGRLVPGSIALALWVAFLETLQMLMQGRTATISEPLWVLIVAIVMSQISRFVPSLTGRDTSARRKESPVAASALPDAVSTSPPSVIRLSGPILRVIGACAVLAVLIAVALRIPGVPYNVRELFWRGGSYLDLLVFSAALLWIGAGGYWMGWRLAISRYPYLVLPVLVAIVSIPSLLMLNNSVTQESIADIAGSNNVYRFVTNKGIWGPQASMMFTALDMPGLVAFFERPIRYTALYGPLVIFLGVMFAVAKQPLDDQHKVQKTIVLLVSALPWLWLCKAIAFDWPATDNLQELIARDGYYGWGGGGYLYFLLALTCMNAVVLSCMRLKRRQILLVTLFTAVAVSIGWVLLNLGLEQRIDKYGRVFSGVQFLLGPDRSRLLSGDVLFLRWAVIYVGGVMIIATGSWLARPFLERWETKNNHPMRVHSNPPKIAWPFPWLSPSFRGNAFKKDAEIATAQPAISSEPTQKTRSSRQAIVITIIVTLAVVGAFWQLTDSNQNPWQDESKLPTLLPPEELPAVAITGFRYPHPRLPAPSAKDITSIKQNNPRYFKDHKKRANGGKGKFFSVILTAFVEPGSQDLNLLHRRLMELELSWRGNVQAKPLAVAYDWLYDQWNPEQRKQLLAKVIEASNYLIEFIRVKQRLSPYNVYLYNSPFQALMATSLASYGDTPDAELPMRWTADYWKNHVLPVWRQVMGNNGGWHEGGEYVGIGIGQAIYQLPAMWRKATAEDLFRSEPGIQGFLDFLIYRTRPDGTHMRWGDAAHFDNIVPDRVPLAIEYSHAAAYSLNRCPRPYKPTSWPWGPLTTDALCKPEAHRVLPLQKHFDGIGMVIARSRWDKEAAYLTFKAGNNFWSHSQLDQGAFTLFKGGPLAIDSGLYGPTYGSDHHMNYSYQTIAHNIITVTDPDDNVPAPPKKKGEPPRKIANDGGQRRIGSGWGVESAPLDLNEWLQKSDIYQTGKIERYYDKDDLVIAVADITPAYTNEYSGKGYFSHRTRRVEKYWRTLVYDRANDVVIVYDNLVSTDPMFRKKSLIHTINEPRRIKNGFVAQVSASERTPTRKAGHLQASILFPEDVNILIIGGKELEFLVDNINLDEAGAVWKKVWKKKKNPPEPGRWRVEISPAIAQKRDRFLMILKPTIENQQSDLRIRRLVTEKAIGSEIKGTNRTLKLLFPNDREGIIVEIEDKMGSKTLDLTLEAEKPAQETLWQKFRHALGY